MEVRSLTKPVERECFHRVTRALVLLVPAAVLGLGLLDRPGFFISSDTLLPASFVWDARHHPYAWSGFQQARVPSFIPDMLLYAVVQIGTGSWRIAMAVWIVAMLGWLLVLGSWIADRMARPGSGTGPLCFVLLTLVLFASAMLGFPRFAADADSAGYFFPYLFVLLPFTHGGPFLLALTGAAVASRETGRPTGAGTAALAGLSWAAALSDMLCFISLLVPLTATLLASRRVDAIPRGMAHRVLAAAWSGGALGWASAERLNRQPIPFPYPAEIPAHVARFITDLPHHPGMALVMAALGLTLAIAARQMPARSGIAGGTGRVLGSPIDQRRERLEPSGGSGDAGRSSLLLGQRPLLVHP